MSSYLYSDQIKAKNMQLIKVYCCYGAIAVLLRSSVRGGALVLMPSEV